MHLTYVIPYFAPAWGYGGPPRLAYDMARQMRSRGHDVSVVTTDALDERGRARPRSAYADGIRVARVPNVSNRLAWQYKLFFPVGFGSALAQSLQGSDVAHLFDFRDYLNAVALRQLERRRIPYVLSALGELPRARGPKRPFKVLFDALYGFRLLNRAAALLAQTHAEASWYRRLGGRPEQIRLLPLAVDTSAIEFTGEPGAFRARLGIPASDILFLFLGRIHEYKGIGLLVRAFAKLRAKRNDVRLVIAGRDDGFLASARQIARTMAPPDDVLFPGPIYGSARFDAYRDADVFVLTPSHAEQTSLAALEACAVGTPALLTQQAPIDGLDAVGGGITVPFDVDAVTQALFTCAAADRARMGACAAELVAQRFAWPVVARQLEGIYDDAAQTAPNR